MTRRSGFARLLPAAAAIALVAAACGSDEATDSASPAPAESSSDSDSSADEAPAGQPAADGVPELLQFTAPLVGGGEFDGASTAGTPTAFWFWSPT